MRAARLIPIRVAVVALLASLQAVMPTSGSPVHSPPESPGVAAPIETVAATAHPTFAQPNGEAYYFLIREPAGEERDPVYVYDAEEDRLLKARPGQGTLDDLTRDGSRSVRAPEWVVLPRAVRAYTEPSLDAARSSFRLSFPEKVTAATRTIVTDTDGTRFVRFTYQGDHYFLPAALVVGNTAPGDLEGGGLPIGGEIVDRETPLPLDYEPADLVRIDQRWNFHAEDYPKFLRAEAAALLVEMLREAERQRIRIRVFSAYRSSDKQRFLYLSALSRSGLEQRAVAKPGHSEHQLGTAVDLCGLDPQSVASAGFGETREGRWLARNALRYGFRQSYTRENRPVTGYIPEPWHYRYIGRRGRRG